MWLSTTSWQGVGTPQFIGLTNFRSMFSSGGFFDVWRTLIFAGVASVGAVIVGIALAELIRGGIRGAGVFSRTLVRPGGDSGHGGRDLL